MADTYFTLKIHHRGYFDNVPEKGYLGGMVQYIKDIDSDRMSYFEMVDIIRDLGEPDTCKMYHLLPDADLDGGLRELTSDNDVSDMFAIHNGRPIITIYVESPIITISTEVNCVIDVEEDDDESEGERINDMSTDRESFSDGDLEYFADGDIFYDGIEELSGHDDNTYGNGAIQVNVGSMSGIRNGEGPSMKAGSVSGCKNGEGPSSIPYVDEPDFDDFSIPINSSDDEKQEEFPEFNEDTDMEHPDFEVGTMFSSGKVFRAALREHAIRNGTDFVFLKNEGNRVTVKCKNDCGWRLHASFFQDTTAFQIKSLKNHPCSCPRQYKVKHANSSWISRKYTDRLMDDPNWKISAMRKAVKRDWMMNVSDSQVYRAKRRALEAIEGNHKQQYWRLRDCCEMILKTNHGSTALLKVNRDCPNSAPTFQRLFVVYDAQRRGFMSGCRPIIGLDACHLKGPFLGQLMHAVGKDANN